ncbi:PAS domain-containing protein [Luminiphilus sp. nBUS_07]|uniref:PAS domain-containing protein n=1 Tax=Luminiphilus sp. nBUS_07 TaxID=3395314 RepID=UPI003EBC9DBE
MPDRLALITDLQSLSYEDAIAFINHLPFAYYRADLDGRVLAASSNAVQIFGYGRVEEIMNVKLGDYYVEPDGRERFMAALVEGEGAVENFEAEMRGPKGNFWVATTAKLIYDTKNTPIAVEGLTRDISEQRKIFEILGQDGRFFRAFTSAAGLGVSILKTSGQVVFANEQILNLLGISRADSETSNITTIMEPELRLLTETSMAKVLGGSPEHLQEALITVKGKKTWLSYSLFLMDDPTSKDVLPLRNRARYLSKEDTRVAAYSVFEACLDWRARGRHSPRNQPTSKRYSSCDC